MSPVSAHPRSSSGRVRRAMCVAFYVAGLATVPAYAAVRDAPAPVAATPGVTTAPGAGPACRALARRGTPDDIAAPPSPGGALWYGDRRGNRLIRIAADGEQTPFVPVSGATSGLSGLAFGADGALWYTKDSSNRIGRIAANGGTAREFATLEGNSFPAGLLADRKGRLWFHARGRNYVGFVRANGSVIVHRGPVAASAGFAPQAMALGADGNLWITDRGHNAIYRFDVETRRFTRFDIPTPRADPGAITAGADGNVWFTMNAVGRVGRITPAGDITEIALGTPPGVGLRGIVGTADGSLWVTARGPQVARVLPDGSVRAFACGNGLGTALLGPGGVPWFLDDERAWVVENADARQERETSAPAAQDRR